MSAFFSSTLPVVLRAQRPDLGVHGPLTRHCFYGSSIHVSRKGWHMLLNLCFHMAMTSAVFAGGITLTNYQMVCQAVSRGRAGVSRMGASSLGTEEGGTQAGSGSGSWAPAPWFWAKPGWGWGVVRSRDTRSQVEVKGGACNGGAVGDEAGSNDRAMEPPWHVEESPGLEVDRVSAGTQPWGGSGWSWGRGTWEAGENTVGGGFRVARPPALTP